MNVAGGALNVCITDEVNQNLTSGQKLLLTWHFKLAHMGFGWLQWLGHHGYLPEAIRNVERPLCAFC